MKAADINKMLLVAEDFYSTQSRLREEQKRLLSLLKDDRWPSSAKKKGTRPSSPPECDRKTSNSNKQEDECEIILRDRHKVEKSTKSSAYHSACSPEEPSRKFTATPIPKGILKGILITIFHFLFS